MNNNFGFIRVAAAVPKLRPADPEYNVSYVLKDIEKAENEAVSLLVFPELSVTGYTCGDLFSNRQLLSAAEDAVKKIRAFTRGKHVTTVVGAPVSCGNSLYNCAIVITNGVIKGIVPKIHLPGNDEFYEYRWFASGVDFMTTPLGEGKYVNDGQNCVKEGFGGEICYTGTRCTISPNMLFKLGESCFAIEICEDLWTPIPPSSFHCAAGADIILNLSASNEVYRKHLYRHKLLNSHSSRTVCGYVYSSAGYGESTTDLVYSGAALIYENGKCIAEAQRFGTEGSFTVGDLDCQKLKTIRQKKTSYDYRTPDGRSSASFRHDYLVQNLGASAATDFKTKLYRSLTAYPFIPSGTPEAVSETCRELLNSQVSGLMRRLEHISCKSAVIGISGGLDSTLALIVTALAFDRLGLDRKGIIGITMPGLGTSKRTHSNADTLMEEFGITAKDIPVVDAVNLHFRDIEHDPTVMDATYENAQARERTQILMDMANKHSGIVIGTGDLSELALGWCTYNGDHMSMYAVNASVSKTQARCLCKWAAENIFADSPLKDVILDVVATPISPELKPTDADGNIAQLTEDILGPYELHDFFLYNFVRFGYSKEKIAFLAEKAFEGIYDKVLIDHSLSTFMRRFFSQQFKRSCLPDGPKVGRISLSPRGDWRMPSDAGAELFK